MNFITGKPFTFVKGFFITLTSLNFLADFIDKPPFFDKLTL